MKLILGLRRSPFNACQEYFQRNDFQPSNLTKLSIAGNMMLHVLVFLPRKLFKVAWARNLVDRQTNECKKMMTGCRHQEKIVWHSNWKINVPIHRRNAPLIKNFSAFKWKFESNISTNVIWNVQQSYRAPQSTSSFKSLLNLRRVKVTCLRFPPFFHFHQSMAIIIIDYSTSVPKNSWKPSKRRQFFRLFALSVVTSAIGIDALDICLIFAEKIMIMAFE